MPLPGSFTPAQMAHALDDAGIDALLTDDDTRARGVAAGLARRRRRRPSRACTGSAASSTRRPRPPLPAGTRKITYTSGSTASAEGRVPVGPGARGDRASRWPGATRELAIERHLCMLPLATLLENVAGLYAPLLRGATLRAAAELESRA